MFHAIINVSTLRDYLQTFTPVVSEAIIHLREDELYAQPVDPAKVAMINQRLDEAAFEAYESSGGQIGLNLTQLDEYLAKVGSDTLVDLELDDETRRLHIDTGRSEYTMACIDPDAIRGGVDVDGMDILDALTTDVRMEGAAFKHALDVTKMVSDHVVVESDPDRERPLHFIGEGDTDDVVVRFGDSLNEGSTIDEDAKSIFNNDDYLSPLAKAIPKDAEVRFRHGDEHPCRIDYEYADGNATVAMMCAPRITTR